MVLSLAACPVPPAAPDPGTLDDSLDTRNDTTALADVYERDSPDVSAVESEVAANASRGIAKALKAE
jgi:hypothetical protein